MLVDVKLQATSNGVRLSIHVKTMRSETKLIREPDGSLTMHVAAPPTKGKANREIVKWISKKLRKPSSNIRLVAGSHSDTKVLEILGVNGPDLAKALGIGRQDTNSCEGDAL